MFANPLPPGLHRVRQSLARSLGLSMVEIMCTVSLLTTLAGIALPNLDAWRTRQAVLGVAAELETDIQLARSTAVALQNPIRLETQALDNGSCYLLHTGNKHQCECIGQGQAKCLGDAKVVRLAEQPLNGGARLTTTDISVAFDPHRGTVTPTATFKVVDKHGNSIHQVVNIMGRVRSCTPNGGSSGIKSC
ncbi:MAG: GspH/FimT family pseudopilin [Burkholderiales bacterium]|nr:GspH/FimT family pseudopilin [Burkholderiales bacterium]